jgi:hypothetical protein
MLIVVSPVLFCLGISLTSKALHREAAETSTRRSLSYFVPISLTVILTHFTGFEIALPIGVCYFWLYEFTVRSREQTRDRAKKWSEETVVAGILVVSSGVIAVLLGLIKIGLG